MKRNDFDQLAERNGMSERIASPFGRPHYVNDGNGAEVEIILRGQEATLEILFEAESLSHLNRSTTRPMNEWTQAEAETELANLFHRRKRHEAHASLFAEMEDA